VNFDGLVASDAELAGEAELIEAIKPASPNQTHFLPLPRQ
jgi:hypothetical protein